MTKKFVFCADVHLEDGAWSTRPAIYGDAYCSFAQIVDYCVKHKLPLILGGDILEKKQNLARPIAKLCAGLTQMQEAGLPVYYIQGNHEYDRNAPWLSVHPWPKHLHRETVNIDGLNVYGIDWTPKGDIQKELAAVPEKTDILITHQVWEEFMGGVGRIECKLSDVHNVQVILNGDFHVNKTVYGENIQHKTVCMYSPGSTSMQDISEAPDKFFFIVGSTASGTEVMQLKLQTRPFALFTLTTQEELDDFCFSGFNTALKNMPKDLPATINKPLIRVKFNKDLPDAYLRIVTAVGEDAHLFCDAISEKNKETTVQRSTRKSSKDDLVVAISDLLAEDTEAIKLAELVLNSVEPIKELEEHYAQYIKVNTDAASTIRSPELGTSSSV